MLVWSLSMKKDSIFVQGPDIQMDWTIWKTADPMTTKMNKAKSSGETG